MNTSQIKTTDVIAPNMSLGELWGALARLSSHVNDDNKLYPDSTYPIEIRTIQIRSICSLLEGIQQHHTKAQI